jgi:hypothetical protein
MGRGASDSRYGASRVAQQGRKKDYRETQCSICKRAIYADDQRTWVHGEVIGLVHIDCLDPPGE